MNASQRYWKKKFDRLVVGIKKHSHWLVVVFFYCILRVLSNMQLQLLYCMLLLLLPLLFPHAGHSLIAGLFNYFFHFTTQRISSNITSYDLFVSHVSQKQHLESVDVSLLSQRTKYPFFKLKTFLLQFFVNVSGFHR